MDELNLWLDDVRPVPDGFTGAHSVNEAIRLVKECEHFAAASLDHDLGDYEHDGGDAIKFVDWMAEWGMWPSGDIYIHSSNPVGRDNMRRTIEAYRERFPNGFHEEE